MTEQKRGPRRAFSRLARHEESQRRKTSLVACSNQGRRASVYAGERFRAGSHGSVRSPPRLFPIIPSEFACELSRMERRRIISTAGNEEPPPCPTRQPLQTICNRNTDSF